MTCFWDGIMSSLTQDEFKGMCKNKFQNQKEFVEWLISHNERTPTVLWNNTPLSEKELTENYTHIQNFDPTSIYNGYDCSSSEPFLFLISSLFTVNIKHSFNGNMINYTVPNPRKILYFNSNSSHFWKA